MDLLSCSLLENNNLLLLLYREKMPLSRLLIIGNQMSNHTSNFNVIYAINQSPIFVQLVMDLYSPNSVNLNLCTVVTLMSFT